MKKIALMLCGILAFGMLAACGGGAKPNSGASSSAAGQYGSTANYLQVILDARDPELNTVDMYTPVVPEDGTEPDFDYSDYDSLSDDQKEWVNRYRQYGLLFDDYSVFERDTMKDFAISSPDILIVSYGVAIILPEEGKQQQVIDQLNTLVTEKQKAMENYLRPQYEIAKAAIVKTVPTGEVLLAMCEDAEAVMAAMEAALAAG